MTQPGGRLPFAAAEQRRDGLLGRLTREPVEQVGPMLGQGCQDSADVGECVAARDPPGRRTLGNQGFEPSFARVDPISQRAYSLTALEPEERCSHLFALLGRVVEPHGLEQLVGAELESKICAIRIVRIRPSLAKRPTASSKLS